jgi:hypothetical protein
MGLCCQRLGLKAAALFDGDKAGKEAFVRCKKAFAGKSRVMIRILPTADIRDKPDEGKQGIFNKDGIMKEENREEWGGLLDDFSSFLNSSEPKSVTLPSHRNNWWMPLKT